MIRHKALKITPVLSELLTKHVPAYDYIETWALTMTPGDTTDFVEWAHAVFCDMPVLMRALFKLRHILVRPFGLKTKVPGQPYTGFPLLDENDGGIILWFEDKHLTLWVTIGMEAGERILLSTAVKMHNNFGRIYLAMIRLLHPLLIRYCVWAMPCPLAQQQS
jgi:hypothetical protein